MSLGECAYFFHDAGIYRASFSISIPMSAAASSSPFIIPSTRKYKGKYHRESYREVDDI